MKFARILAVLALALLVPDAFASDQRAMIIDDFTSGKPTDWSLSGLAGLRAARRGRTGRSRRLLTALTLLGVEIHGRARHALNISDSINHWINPYFRLPPFIAVFVCCCPSPRLRPTPSGLPLTAALVASASFLPDLDFI